MRFSGQVCAEIVKPHLVLMKISGVDVLRVLLLGLKKAGEKPQQSFLYFEAFWCLCFSLSCDRSTSPAMLEEGEIWDASLLDVSRLSYCLMLDYNASWKKEKGKFHLKFWHPRQHQHRTPGCWAKIFRDKNCFCDMFPQGNKQKLMMVGFELNPRSI